MHEITLCQRALELIEQQAVAHGAKPDNWGLAQNWRIFLRRNQRSLLLF